VKGAWQDLWMKHPLPTKDEPEKWVSHLTDPSFFVGDEHHLGALYDMASLRGIEQFFMQVRRRYSLLERTLS
jgi:hypothetical protein